MLALCPYPCSFPEGGNLPAHSFFLSASGSCHQGQPLGWENTEARECAIAAGHVPGEAEKDECGALLPPCS